VPSSQAVAAISRALEGLLRLSSSRRVFARRAALAEAPISQQGYVLLRRIRQDGPLPMGELARITHTDPGATARQIGQLERDGFVRRYPSPQDGRVNLVEQTLAGDAVCDRITRLMERHMNGVLASWSDRDRREFARLLTRFVDDLRRDGYTPPEEKSA
jgi:DNA-binding MarR family transcriptional regulator